MDLTLRPQGSVRGAVAGYTFPFEPFRPGAKALQAFEECGVGPRMLPKSGCGPFAGFGVSGPTGAFDGSDPPEDPAEQGFRVET